jgi:TIR domain
MSKVFLAYKRIDLERANMVRAKLEALGVPLFIDQKQGAGENYIRTINEELNSAIAALVLWTKAAVVLPESGEPNFMLSEAQRGYSRGILITATFDKIVLDHLPVPFNTLQASDLSDWIEAGASARHPEWQKVLEAVGKKLGRPGLPDLAIALESGTDDLKRKFLKKYPADPAAQQITAFIEAYERKEFETQFSTAKKRIQQRARDAEKKLKSCRDEFEAQVVELRAGRNFMPPDPVEAIEDQIGVLSNEIEIRERTIDEERHRADRTEDLAVKASAEVAELKSRLSANAVTLDARNVAIEQLNSDLAKRDEKIADYQSAIASHAPELARLADAAAVARQESEANGARIGELQALTTLLKERLQGEMKRLFIWSGAAAAIAACVFLFIGKSFNPAKSDVIVQALNAKITNLTAQNQTLKTQAPQAASASIPLVAQCDALAGYQYDPDRPPDNGWALAIKDIPATQAICQSALQTSGIDQITQRRMLLELARTYVESAPVDYNTYVDNLNKASRLGSSQADYQLGMYYAAQNNPQLAWDRIQRSAAAHNPVALNRAAISQIFPSWNEHFITAQALDSGFRYLQQALDAAYFRSYYVAGAAYWTYKDRDTPDRSKAIYFLTVSQCVADRRDPTDKENYKDGADYYYLQKAGKRLTCPQ